jgi:predicted CoA-binding protein
MASNDEACPLPPSGGDARIKEILGRKPVTAVVGMSPKSDRPSYEVGLYLHEQGFPVIPVHPKAKEIGGLAVYPSLEAIPAARGPVFLVDLFVAGERTGEVVEQAARIGAKCVWFQPGTENPASEARARALGLEVISGRCTMAEHRRLFGG